jgi:hypothetical protein
MSDDLDALVSQVEALHLEDDSALVLSVPGNVSRDTVAYLKEHLEWLFRDRKVVVLVGGMQLSPLGQHRQLQRIEAALAKVQGQLSTLLQALAQEEEPAQAYTLDGGPFSARERDPSQPL